MGGGGGGGGEEGRALKENSWNSWKQREAEIVC